MEISPTPVEERIRLILHVDADAFYASVEQALNPELKGRAVVVGGTERGVVSAASYEARGFGVHSAMPVVTARRLCPHAVFLTPNFDAYKDFSRRMFRIMGEYSPAVESSSIDEGYVDLTGTLRLHRSTPWAVAHRILTDIRSTLGINCSGGLAGSKCAAKMATNLAKPNGLLYLEPDQAFRVLGRLPVERIPGVGKKARARLWRHNIRTVGDLAEARGGAIRSIMGRHGEKLVEIAAGRDSRPVSTRPRGAQKSYSKDRTLPRDTGDYQAVRAIVRELAEKLAARVRAHGTGACTVTFRVRYEDFSEVSKSMSLRQPVCGNREILQCVDRLFGKTITRRSRIRQVGVKLSGIQGPVFQADLFDPTRPSRDARDKAVDSIRERFGFDSVRVTG